MLWVVLAIPVASAAAPAADLPPLAGLSLPEALRVLQDRGWPLVFSNRLVRDAMRVVEEPVGADPAALLTDLLRPHRLAVRGGARDRFVIVAAPKRRSDPRPVRESSSEQRTAAPPAAPATTLREEIVVTPGRDPSAGASVLSLTLDPGGSGAAPSLGEDAFGEISVLPGASSTAGSARLNVRGSGDDDVLVLLDGLELVAPYHLADFDSAVSLMTPSSVERADLFTGGYPAQYGGRMGGVVDLTTRMPTQARHFSLGLDVLDIEGAASGLFFGERSRWLATARSGSYQWPLERSGRDQHPRYWDTFGKLDVALGRGQSLAADVLIARDDFELSSEHGTDAETYRSGWDSRYVWGRHTAVLGRQVYADTVAGSGRVGRDRAGSLRQSGSILSARERRYVDRSSARQNWHWEAGHRTALKWGFDLDRSDTTIDFWSDRDRSGPPPSTPADLALGAGGVVRDFGSTHQATYVSTQLQPFGALSIELGLRHETVSLIDESQLSPRLAAAWEVGPRSVLRAAWGWFYQSQRPYELEVENASASGLLPIAGELAEHHVLSYQHRFGRGMNFLAEAYRRRLNHPRVRFENVFDPVLAFPELGDYRVRVDPESGTAEGLELSLRQPVRKSWGWWATYVRSSVVDEFEQGSIPRSIDQPHSFRAGVSYRAGRSWELDLLWQYHTGWPTTTVEAKQIETADGTLEWIAVPGPRNGGRLPDYHRLDLRAGRSWSLGPGRLSAHLDLLDVYDRRNLRGFEDLRLVPDARGGVEQSRRPVTWTGFVPSVGVRWEF